MIEPPTSGAGQSVSAAILAGGRARRMHGLDKSALAVDGLPILERQLAVLGQLTDDLLIVVRGDDEDPARFARGGARVVTDLVPDIGPLGGLYTALVHAAAPVTIVVACDMPFLTLPFLRHLATRVAGMDVAVPRTTDGYHPLCAAYAHTVRPFVERQLARGALAVQALFTGEPAARVVELGTDELAAFDPDGRLLSNVNTPHDYRQACSRALNR
jgi:molybdenum cofactor guanylyltransferase